MRARVQRYDIPPVGGGRGGDGGDALLLVLLPSWGSATYLLYCSHKSGQQHNEARGCWFVGLPVQCVDLVIVEKGRRVRDWMEAADKDAAGVQAAGSTSEVMRVTYPLLFLSKLYT